MGIKTEVKQLLTNINHKKYEEKKKKCTLSFYDIFQLQQEEQQRFMDDKITSDIVILQCHDGILEPKALQLFTNAFDKNPKVDLIYCDEAVKENGIFPEFRSDWSPDTFLHHYNLGSVVAIRKTVLNKNKNFEVVQKVLEISKKKKIVFLPEEELYEVCKQIVKIKTGFNNVIHLDWILFWRKHRKVNRIYALTEKMILKDILVSIIIPSKDHPELLEKCLNSLLSTTKGMALEICVVDNGSSLENQKVILELSQKFGFLYLYEKFPFNFSKMCNLGAKSTKGKHLLFLNDDIECISEGWLQNMVFLSEREHVGAVGSKLLYPDRQKIQHAGIVNLPMGPVHKLQFLDDTETYYDEFNRGERNVIAVTGACLLVKRELYQSLGGMDEGLSVAFNDVEICFRLHEAGYYNVVIQDSPLVHHESVSRGEDESIDKWKRLMAELERLYKSHPLLKGNDPFYSDYLNSFGLNSKIYPGFLDGKHKIQKESLECCKKRFLSDAMEESCLLFRVEQFQDSLEKLEMSGYGIVLGSDNACYKKFLIVKKVDNQDLVYKVMLMDQYRWDLEQNMLDQKNVSLSGFWISFEKDKLEKGLYQIGFLAEKKFSRSKLYTWVERQFEVL